MGIVEHELVKFSIGKDNYIIEYNAGDSIHIHIDDMRFEMSSKEFEDMCDVVIKGRDKLLAKKKIKNE